MSKKTSLMRAALERLEYHASQRHGGYCESQATAAVAAEIRQVLGEDVKRAGGDAVTESQRLTAKYALRRFKSAHRFE